MYKVCRVEYTDMDAVKAAVEKYKRDQGSTIGFGSLLNLDDEEMTSLLTGKPTELGVSVQPIVRPVVEHAISQREANRVFSLLSHKLNVSEENRMAFIVEIVGSKEDTVRWQCATDLGVCDVVRDQDGIYLEIIEDLPIEDALLSEIKVDEINRRIAMLMYQREENNKYEMA